MSWGCCHQVNAEDVCAHDESGERAGHHPTVGERRGDGQRQAACGPWHAEGLAGHCEQRILGELVESEDGAHVLASAVTTRRGVVADEHATSGIGDLAGSPRARCGPSVTTRPYRTDRPRVGHDTACDSRRRSVSNVAVVRGGEPCDALLAGRSRR